MKVLLCHNYYQQAGGEDEVFAAERDLLVQHGNDVFVYTRHNDELAGAGRLRAARDTLWNQQTYDEVSQLIHQRRPDVMHCTNIFPLISPSVYQAARDAGVPVVQSLHNYRLICPKALLTRDGSICESCVGKRFAWPAIWHGCYRDDRLATAVVAGMLSTHWRQGTWTKQVDQYIALTAFSRRKLTAGGLPAEKITVKPNFVPVTPAGGTGRGGYAVFVGRLSNEKGIDTLLRAWELLDGKVPLRIIGDGPMRDVVQAAAARDGSVQWLGRRTREQVLETLSDARVLVFPSQTYETFGLAIIEAFSVGTPAVVSRMGAMQELVDHGRTGLHFEAGNAQDLAAQVRRIWNESSFNDAMRDQCRQEFLGKYTAERNYEQMLNVYRRAGVRLPTFTARERPLAEIT